MAGIRAEILLMESADDAESLMRDLMETSTGVLAWVRTEILLTESAEDADALMRILTEIFTGGAPATPTAG